MANKINNQQDQDGVTEKGRGAGGKKKKRWWLRILVSIFLLIILFIALIPTLASLTSVRHAIVSAINEQTDYRIEVQEFSVSWRDSCHLAGLKVWDGEGREIVALEKASLGNGLIGMIMDPMAFGEITLDGVSAVVYLPEESTKKTQGAGEPGKGERAPGARVKQPTSGIDHASGEGSGEDLPAIIGTCVVRNGQVRIVRPDGKALVVSEIDGQVEVNTLDKVKGHLNFNLNDQG
ncbi:MAG: hypothetical protein K9M57_11185, partial [Phycisphaerae bacterium]|nr:hypothetical protein [Phycisphaerae bacterium]